MVTRVLIVDDDVDIREGLKSRLAWLGHEPLVAEDGERALTVIEQDRPDLLLLDIEMPGLSGIDVLKRLADANPRGERELLDNPLVIVMTAYGTIHRAVEAMRLGAFDFITKPFEAEHLSVVMRKALERQVLVRQVHDLRDEIGRKYERIIGSSPRMRSALEMARQAAGSQANVLLLGETGTGKELVARAIHRWSQRESGPFMVINCAAMPASLLENELFGHEKGAFTGATDRQIGKIEAADRGTVFLDEIGDMPMALQANLLRVLQDQEFHRIGGIKTVRVSVRFVAATNKDLKHAVRTAAFREDLYFRLNVLSLSLPPLRERMEDLQALATFLLQEAGTAARKGPLQLSPEALELMMQYHWPGNVRELENVLSRAALLSNTTTIEPEHLGLTVEAINLTPSDHDRGDVLPYHEAMEQYSRHVILQALKRAGWNQTKAAEALGLQRTYLTKLLKQRRISGRPPEGGGS